MKTMKPHGPRHQFYTDIKILMHQHYRVIPNQDVYIARYIL
jgi:hypothetical protein